MSLVALFWVLADLHGRPAAAAAAAAAGGGTGGTGGTGGGGGSGGGCGGGAGGGDVSFRNSKLKRLLERSLAASAV